MHLGRGGGSTAVWVRAQGPSRARVLAAVTAKGDGRQDGIGRRQRYRPSTVQVRVRVMPSTTWMRETTSRPSSSSPGACALAMPS